jgi:hypothetical protein
MGGVAVYFGNYRAKYFVVTMGLRDFNRVGVSTGRRFSGGMGSQGLASANGESYDGLLMGY